MNDFTRRPTNLGNPADYVFRYNGKDVGRCYRSHFGITVGQAWLWTIYSPKTIPGVADKGYEATLEEAQDAFKTNYLKMFGI